MKDLEINKAILTLYPKAADCMNGHIGVREEYEEEELDDDRYYLIKVIRCGHCYLPLNEQYK